MKGELDVIRDLYGYNTAVRNKYLQRIWSLPAADRYRDRGASFPSLVDIYMHVLDAYRWWFIVVYDRAGPIEWYPLAKRYTRSEAKRETRNVERCVQSVLSNLHPSDLSRKIPIPRSRGRHIRIRDLLLHMAEEELQHRGEMNALLWQSDIDPPISGFGDR